MSLMMMVAERGPTRLGRNVTVIVQNPFGKMLPPPTGQLLVCGNRPGFAPPIEMLFNTKGTVPVLVSVTVCGGLIVLIGTLPNAREVGESVTAGRMVVPVRVTVPVTAGRATATRTVAFLVVVLLGVNVTLTVQLPPIPRPAPLIGQLWVRPKRCGFAPPRVMPVILKGALPVLETVIAWATVVTLIGELNVNAGGARLSTGPVAVTVKVPGTYVML